MTRVRFSLVGCGSIHRLHVQALGKLKDDAEIVAVCNLPLEKAQASAETLGVRAYDDYEEMLKRDDIDVIVVATQSGLHAEQGIQALRAGKHVITEKPMDVSLAQANALVRAAREAGLLLTPVSQNRYGEGLLQLHQWLQKGKLGKLVYGDASVKWYRSQNYYDASDWRGTWELDGGGALMNQGVHYADQLRWVMGPIKNLSARAATLGHARIDVEDVVTAAIEFESGAIGTLMATTCAYPGFEAGLDVFGTEGAVRIKNNEIVEAKFKDGTTYHPKDRIGSVGGSDPKAIDSALHTRQFKDFIDAIREGRDPWITGEMGRDALELIIGVYRSAFTGETVTFPLPADTGRGR